MMKTWLIFWICLSIIVTLIIVVIIVIIVITVLVLPDQHNQQRLSSVESYQLP